MVDGGWHFLRCCDQAFILGVGHMERSIELRSSHQNLLRTAICITRPTVAHPCRRLASCQALRRATGDSSRPNSRIDMLQPVGGFACNLAARVQDLANDGERLLPFLHARRQQGRNRRQRRLFSRSTRMKCCSRTRALNSVRRQASDIVGSKTNSSNKLEGSFVDRASRLIPT